MTGIDICFSVGYFMTLSLSKSISVERLDDQWNGELKKIWKEEVVSKSSDYPGSCLLELIVTMKHLIQERLWSGRDAIEAFSIDASPNSSANLLVVICFDEFGARTV
jgi:hypothetical protein